MTKIKGAGMASGAGNGTVDESSDVADIGEKLIGKVLRFDYPKANHAFGERTAQTRRVVVRAVRDVTVDKLDSMTPTLRPWLSRSRFLISGLDLDKMEERSFYGGSMTDVEVFGDADCPVVADCAVVEIDVPEDLICDFDEDGEVDQFRPVRLLSLGVTEAEAEAIQAGYNLSCRQRSYFTSLIAAETKRAIVVDATSALVERLLAAEQGG